jgi:hypothetical protein
MTSIALFSKKGDAGNAMFAFIGSIATWGISHFVFEMEFPVLLTMIMCGVCYFLPLLFSKGRNDLVEN